MKSNILMTTILAICLFLLTSPHLEGRTPPGERGKMEPVPHFIICSESQPRPLFISSEKAFDESGNLKSDLVEPEFVQKWLDLFLPLEPGDDGCIQQDFFSSLDVPSPDWLDLSSALKNSHEVIYAAVTGSRPGFTGGGPVTLLQLETIEMLKELPGKERRQTVYVAFKGGEVPAGDARLCIHGINWPSYVPQIGDQVVVMLDRENLCSESRFLSVSRSSILVFTEDQIYTGDSFSANDPILKLKSAQWVDAMKLVLDAEP